MASLGNLDLDCDNLPSAGRIPECGGRVGAVVRVEGANTLDPLLRMLSVWFLRLLRLDKMGNVNDIG